MAQRRPLMQVGKEYKHFPTYRELKKNIRDYLSDVKELYIFRSRRGEWGEWFEKWELVSGKPKITKEGWM